MNKIFSRLLMVAFMPFTGHASNILTLEEKAKRISIPPIDEIEKASSGKTYHFPLKDTPIVNAK